MKNTYWNESGTYQEEYNRLVDLVPSMGSSETVAGEMIRAASKLGYDFCNNGMGNNTSGAVNYLEFCLPKETYELIYFYSRGRLYQGNFNGDELHTAIEKMIDVVVKYIIDHPELETKKNETDMLDLSDREQSFCDECGYDMEGEVGFICSECEESHYEDEEIYW